MKYFDLEAIEKKYPLPAYGPSEGTLYVPIQRFKARQVLWGVLVMKIFSLAFILLVAIMGYRLYRTFSLGLTPEQSEFLVISIALLISLGACFSLATYYLATRMVGDVFDRWYHLTDKFVEHYHGGNVKRIHWTDVKKKKFWSFKHFHYGSVSTSSKTIIFTINFVRAYPRPQKVRTGFMGMQLMYEDGRKVKLQDAQKLIFDEATKYAA